MSLKRNIFFQDSKFKPVELPDQACLSEHLTAENSPILFGCRIGICGTCLVEVVSEKEKLNTRTENETEYLETLCPGKVNYRLACQVNINTDISVKKIEL